MKQPRIEVALEPRPDEIEFITQQIIKFNNNRTDSEGDYKPLAIFLRDADNQVMSGLVGETYWFNILQARLFEPGNIW